MKIWRLYKAKTGNGWRKAWGARFEGRFQTSKKTASIQDCCCFFAGLKIWRLYKAKTGNGWRKAWGARFEGRFQTSKKTASIQDCCCFFAGLKIWRPLRQWPEKSVLCKTPKFLGLTLLFVPLNFWMQGPASAAVAIQDRYEKSPKGFLDVSVFFLNILRSSLCRPAHKRFPLSTA